jgi:PAS domain S-box-containing protein
VVFIVRYFVKVMAGKRSIFRNLLIGKEFIPSRLEFKYALLRGQFAVIIFSIAIFYIIADPIHHVYGFIPGYILMVIVSFIIALLNRNRFYHASSILLLTFVNIIVFFFSTVDHPHGGVFFFFMTCSIAGLILAGYYSRYAGILFAVLPIVLGYISYTQDFNFMPLPSYEPGVVQINFIINFIIGILSNIFIVSFLIKRNQESESSLRESEKNLMKIATDLESSQERFALAVKGTNAGVYEWDLRKSTTYVSSTWKNLLGYADDELDIIPTSQFIDIVHPDDIQRIGNLVGEHMKSLLPYQTELRMKTKHGVYRWFSDSGSFKTDGEGNPIKLVGSIIDIDDRKKAEEEILSKNVQLAKTNEELDRFVYSASHDMRAPLSSLLGLINISEKTDNVNELHAYLQMMKGRIKTMEGFIKEVTDYSRNTRLDLVLEKTDLEEVIRDVTQNLSDMTTGKVRIEIDLPEKIILLTDANRLRVILNNLISNAYKYHRLDQPDPYIYFSAKRNNNQVVVNVTDNGFGIEPDYHHKIFDMFFRASIKSEGSGLGLYIVKETIQKMGGTIWVESVPGQGSTFTFAIPA